MRVVDVVNADLMNQIEDVGEVGFGINANPLHSCHDAANHPLLRAGRWVGLACVRPVAHDVQPVQVRQQFLVDEGEKITHLGLEGFALPPDVTPLRGQRVSLKVQGRRPILPTVGFTQGGAVGPAHRFGSLPVAGLLGIEDAQEQNPRQLWHVLQRAGAVGSAHDVADRLDEARQRLRRCNGLGHFAPLAA